MYLEALILRALNPTVKLKLDQFKLIQKKGNTRTTHVKKLTDCARPTEPLST
jgi:hypothetical protein